MIRLLAGIVCMTRLLCSISERKTRNLDYLHRDLDHDLLLQTTMSDLEEGGRPTYYAINKLAKHNIHTALFLH